MKAKTAIKTIRVNVEWWAELSKRVRNVSEYIREAVNEKQARDGMSPLPGEVGSVGSRHDYQMRNDPTEAE